MQNHFDYYGLPVRYGLDERELRQRYLDRSRDDHPDYHRRADAAAQARSLDETARNNAAYRVLRDPRLRMLHILELHGLVGPSGENLSGRQLPPQFLMEMMELNEEAECPTPAERESLLRRTEAESERRQADMQALMTRFDAQEAETERLRSLTEALQIYLEQQYWTRLKNLLESKS